MKKKRIIFLLITVLLILTSCNLGINKIDDSEGSVNYYIYPYLKFTLSPDRTYYSASVVSGAKLETVSVPGFLHTDFGAMPIKEFAGFENSNDSVNLKEVTLDVHIEKVKEGAFDKAENLKVVKTSGDKEGPKWAHLPTLTKDGYHFIGWKAGDNYVFNGMPIDPNNSEAVPVFEEHEYTLYEGKEPTCTEGGYAPYGICKVCGHSTYSELPALGHSIIHHDAVPATCTETGTRDHYECTRCHLYFSDEKGDNIISDIIIPAIGHKLTHIEGKEPTCQTEGVIEHYLCEVCKNAYSDSEGKNLLSTTVIDKVDHKPVDNWSSNSKVHWKKCKWCSYEFYKAEHNFDSGVIIKSATLHTKGEKKFTCNTCAYEKHVDIPEHDHVAGETKVVAPTCFTEGYTLETCANEECGEVIKTNIVPALEHEGTEYERLEPTCMNEGHIAHYHCDRCGYNFESQSSKVILESVKIDKVPHKAGSLYYHDDDNHWNLCIYDCKTKLNITSHSFNQKVIEAQYKVSDKNCIQPDIYHYSCICSLEGTETFTDGEPLGHNLTHHDAKASTCTVQGNIEYWSCSVCKKYFKDEECTVETTLAETKLPFDEHVFDKNNFDTTASGHRRICDVCHQSIGEYVSHTVKKEYEGPNGHWDTCSVCKLKLTALIAHHYVISDGVKYCDYCGYKYENLSSDPGFDVDNNDPTPKGYLEISETNGVFTIQFKNSNESSVPDHFTWYIDGSVISGETSDTFILMPQSNDSIIVLCIFWNESGYGSASETITKLK